MPILSSVPVIIFSGQHPARHGQVSVTHWEKRDRALRALKVLVLLWLAILPAIFIPAIHFILVPLLVLAGPLAALYFYRQDTVVGGGSLVCPACGQNWQMIRCASDWPLHPVCPHCNAFVRVEKDSSDG